MFGSNCRVSELIGLGCRLIIKLPPGGSYVQHSWRTAALVQGISTLEWHRELWKNSSAWIWLQFNYLRISRRRKNLGLCPFCLESPWLTSLSDTALLILRDPGQPDLPGGSLLLPGRDANPPLYCVYLVKHFLHCSIVCLLKWLQSELWVLFFLCEAQ